MTNPVTASSSRLVAPIQCDALTHAACPDRSSMRADDTPLQGIGVPSASVPAAQTTPSASEYIARSTTIGTGVAPRLSMTAPKPLPAASGNSAPTGTLNRLLAGTVKVLATAAELSSNSSVTRTLAGSMVLLAIRKYVWVL